jgi:hypothetical protein
MPDHTSSSSLARPTADRAMAAAESEAACPFCEIVARRRPQEIVYADETVVGFLCEPAATWGHVLVVPRRHRADMWDIPPHGPSRTRRSPGHLSAVRRLRRWARSGGCRPRPSCDSRCARGLRRRASERPRFGLRGHCSIRSSRATTSTSCASWLPKSSRRYRRCTATHISATVCRQQPSLCGMTSRPRVAGRGSTTSRRS